MYTIFVYGTLKRGFRNHYILDGSKFIGEATTMDEYTMLDLGHFPGCVEEDFCRIHGEVYEVDGTTLDRLDMLEDCPNLFYKSVVNTTLGECLMYFFNKCNLPEGTQISINSNGQYRSIN